jgi:hypothetical protein
MGIVSLGLQVYSGIITYYSVWRGAGQEIDDIIQDLESLKSILQSLRISFSRFITSHTLCTAQIEACLASCNASILNLEEYLKKCPIPTQSPAITGPSPASIPNQLSGSIARPPNSRNLSDRIKNQAKRAIFPFRRNSLISLKGRILFWPPGAYFFGPPPLYWG